ncbi:group II intron reverse transcriptase/maturase [Wolbachia endosymbiont (group A) of Anomoia purmunda]|uniref:group II intron reverse transcriptase/maturase n=1 Tax=Wolbachia endosymbiont (group A) of Anomoia purmunda TaxID=2953978 RepID=UPI002232030B|nr:group II intron reverse transcriptase/maturase [Wolbachia endosymbiont (group A) of Anomoia purmunda]
MMDFIYQDDKSWLLAKQRKLYTWSRNNPSQAWRDMWNWVTQLPSLRLVWKRVASNKGARTAGVDNMTVKRIRSRKGGVIDFLQKLQTELRSGTYRPTSVKRHWISKTGRSSGTRPLGIPTVKDRIVQAAVLHFLEPIFEAEFLAVSYGFRPKKACRDAIEHIRNAIRPTKAACKDLQGAPYQWVIEGDIKGCFDNISHGHVMSNLRRRVKDNKVCRLVKAFLKAGILEGGVYHKTRKGTPQGGILSPLLANISLSAIENSYGRYVKYPVQKNGLPYKRPGDALRKFRHYERKAGRPVYLPIRYSDDFVILVNGTQEDAMREKTCLKELLLKDLKLSLSEEKTKVTRLDEGFTFLSHRIRLRWDNRWGYWSRVEIPKEKIKDFRYQIKQKTLRKYSHLSMEEVISMINPLIRGWGNFYRHCYNAKRVFTALDHYVWDRLWRWLKKQNPGTPQRVLYKRYWQKIENRPRYRWLNVTLMADIKVGRHDLVKLCYPDYASETLESPVHNERCTPGLGVEEEKTSMSNHKTASLPHIHFTFE